MQIIIFGKLYLGQIANSHLGGTRPTIVPLGHCKASLVQPPPIFTSVEETAKSVLLLIFSELLQLYKDKEHINSSIK